MKDKDDKSNPNEDTSNRNNQDGNNNINTPWWSEENSFYTASSTENGVTNYNRISSGEDTISNYSIQSNDTHLFNSSTTLRWSEEVSVQYSTDWDAASTCTSTIPNHPMPMEIQFSGLGDYGPSSYMYAMLFAVAIVGILGKPCSACFNWSVYVQLVFN